MMHLYKNAHVQACGFNDKREETLGSFNKPSQTYIETQVSWQEMKKDSVQLICPGNLAASCVWKGKCNFV